ncbi:hypothetical protein U1Q18_011472 [Sarracenia purpurea var. burkii]
MVLPCVFFCEDAENGRCCMAATIVHNDVNFRGQFCWFLLLISKANDRFGGSSFLLKAYKPVDVGAFLAVFSTYIGWTAAVSNAANTKFLC